MCDKINVLGRAETNIQTDEEWSPWKWDLWLNGNTLVWVRACVCACVHIRSVTDNVHKNGRISALDYKHTCDTYNKFTHTKGIFQVLIGLFLTLKDHTVKSSYIYWWMAIRYVKCHLFNKIAWKIIISFLKQYSVYNDVLSVCIIKCYEISGQQQYVSLVNSRKI